MKKLTVIFLLGILGSVSALKADLCDLRTLSGTGTGVSVLDAIMGDIPRFGEKALKAEQARLATQTGEWFQRGVIDFQLGKELIIGPRIEFSTRIIPDQELSEIAYGNGVLYLLTGDYQKAVEHFDRSEDKAFLGGNCNLREYRLIASYLNQYGDEAPLFAHFNGGFFGFCKDSLRWGKDVYDTRDYQKLVEGVVDLIVLSGDRPVFIELLGDLMSKNEDKVIANWFAASAYLRLMHLHPESQAVWEEKAFYALEAPRTDKRRFDHYQFTQYKKRFQEDLEAIKATRNGYLAQETGDAGTSFVKLKETYPNRPLEFAFLHESDDSNVAVVIRKASKRQMESEGKRGKFEGVAELDKAVKGDAQYNVYAFVMIGVVIFAVVFIGLQTRRNRRNMK